MHGISTLNPLDNRQHTAGRGDGRKNLCFALISGLLLGLPWVFPPLWFLIFIAWIPLLRLEEMLRHRANPYLVFNYALVSFLLWNLLGTWWVSRTHLVGAMLIMLANALVQALFFWLVSRVRTVLSLSLLLPFVLIWMGYEHFHELWDLAWPWLNLGNALATAPGIIQWYEYTGARGGTLWIILVNLAGLQFYTTCRHGATGSRILAGAGVLLIFLVPVCLSWNIFENVCEVEESLPFALVQPNLDPYTEKFAPEKQARHLDAFFRTADALCDAQTRFLFGPETLILQQMDESDPGSSPHFRRLQDFQKKYPQLNILLGVHSFERLGRENRVPGSRYDRQKDFFYEAFNSALFLPPGSAAQFYHKTKLVPLFERMPFVQYLSFLGKYSLELGGYTGTYSNREARSFFETPDASMGILPIVCFESIFGPYCARNLPRQKGFICMITNDGWWKNTPGYQHHFNFSRMRAIECRRTFIRAANNGISALIDARGMVIARTPWWQEATLKGEIPLRKGLTFFSRHGDFLGRIALFSGIFLCLYAGIRNRFGSK
ncbi:MAG: apolipoprotein N-acyltransferase [Deltaproteobacteria bacterium]|nr:apolipoprotein N-acyltransferase [Deltaproteobacteria bacterium]